MKNESNTLRVAAVQMRSSADREENLETARRLMDRALNLDAEMIVLPENFSFLGDDDEKLAVVEDIRSGASVRFLKGYATEHGTPIIGGSIPLAADDPSKVRNTCLVFGSTGEVLARYDKMHLFDIGLDPETTFSESSFVEAGDEIVTVDLLGCRMGLSICYDLRFPELYRSLGRSGAKVLFVPAAFTLQTGRDHWEVLLRARAIENQCYVVAPAQQGRHSERRVTYGRAMIIGPWGQVLGQCQDQEDVVVCDIDLDYLAEVRRRLPCLNHTREDVFG